MEKSGDTETLFDLAVRNYQRASFPEASALLDAVLELEPSHSDAWFLLSRMHRHLGREIAAIAALQRLLRIEPDNEQALVELGDLQTENGRPDMAVRALSRAIEAEPDNPILHYRHGLHLRSSRRTDEALIAIENALRLAPEFDAALFEKTMLHLQIGDLSEGWQNYDRRHVFDPTYMPPQDIPRWTGDPFPGKRLLVIHEGGHGDVIWAARFLKPVQALGGGVHLQMRPALRNLFSELEGIDNIVEPDADLRGFDFYCPILSLPAMLNVSDPHRFPPAILHSQPAEDNRLPRLLARAGNRFRVGIIWSGSETYANNRHRATTLEKFLPIIENPDVQVFSLQKGGQQAVLRESGLGSLIIDADDFDFAETAALIEALDLIIMTDSSVAHISGSLGKPIWNLLDFCPFWIFGLEGDTTPWYPSMRLFRQHAPGDWGSVFSEVCQELEELVALSQYRK